MSMPRVLAVTTLAVVALGVGVVASGALDGSNSDSNVQVEKDPSWLGYLPAQTRNLSLVVGGMTTPTADDVTGRRVDLLDQTHSEGVSLCFGKSAAEATTICPGAHVLGRIDRQVDMPWVAQIGNAADSPWLARLSTPIPKLGTLQYLQK